MSLKIRMKRMGKRNLPFYRLVVVDSRWRRDGKTVANIGWYDPVKNPAQVSLHEKEIYQWLEKGAQMSETARSLLKNYGILGRFKDGSYKAIVEAEENKRIDDIPDQLEQDVLPQYQAPAEPTPEPKEESKAEAQPKETKSEEPTNEESPKTSSEEEKSS